MGSAFVLGRQIHHRGTEDTEKKFPGVIVSGASPQATNQIEDPTLWKASCGFS